MDFWNILLGTISFGSLSYSLIEQHYINSAEKKLKQFLNTKIYAPKDLVHGIKEKEAYLVNRFKDYGKNEISGKIFVEGLPFTDRPIQSFVTSDKLLHSIYYKEDMFSNDRIHSSKIANEKKFKIPENSRKEKVLSFALKDYDGTHQCLVLNNNNEEPNYEAALTLIGEKEETRNLNFLEKFLVFICMFLDFLSSARGESGIRGIQIGVREREIGIKVDTFLTIFGEVIYNFENRTLRIENPEYFLKNKTNLLESIRDYISECKSGRLLFGIIGFVCLGIVGYRVYNKIQNQRQRQIDQVG